MRLVERGKREGDLRLKLMRVLTNFLRVVKMHKIVPINLINHFGKFFSVIFLPRLFFLSRHLVSHQAWHKLLSLPSVRERTDGFVPEAQHGARAVWLVQRNVKVRPTVRYGIVPLNFCI